MAKNPFGDDVRPSGPAANPFGDDEGLDPMRRLEGAPARLRALRAQVGSEGMTGAGMRQLLDELSADLEAVTRLLRDRG